MRLIGMTDSPFVRRVAITLHLKEIPFTQEPLSVFRDFGRFSAINPAVKAPTLVLDDGNVLFESGLILEYLERIQPEPYPLLPRETGALPRALRLIALALAVCEKSVQIVYETKLRPAETQHEAWLDRLRGQLQASLDELDRAVAGTDGWLCDAKPMQPDVSAACAWRFARFAAPGLADPARFPGLAALSERAEATPAFLRVPFN